MNDTSAVQTVSLIPVDVVALTQFSLVVSV